MDNSKKTIEDLMRPMRIKYQQELVERVKILEGFHDILIERQLNDEEKNELTSLSHKLAGTGTTFGFSEISQCGKTLESALKSSNDDQEEDLVPLLKDLISSCTSAIAQ